MNGSSSPHIYTRRPDTTSKHLKIFFKLSNLFHRCFTKNEGVICKLEVWYLHFWIPQTPSWTLQSSISSAMQTYTCLNVQHLFLYCDGFGHMESFPVGTLGSMGLRVLSCLVIYQLEQRSLSKQKENSMESYSSCYNLGAMEGKKQQNIQRWASTRTLINKTKASVM